MKRTIILLLLGIVTAAGSMAQEEFTDGNFRYMPTGATTATVVGLESSMQEDGALAVIPQTTGAYTVTAVGPQAFADSHVAAVYIPSTVTTIGEGAFSRCWATFIKLSPNITSIGADAFSECPALGHLDLPSGLERIEAGTFKGVPLYTLGEATLPHLTSVDDYALAGTRLRSFPLTDAVTHLGTGAFSDCSSLQNIHLPAGLTIIPNELFNGCTALTQVALPAGIVHIGKAAFANTAISNINLAQYTGSIGARAFNGCYSLERLTLPADNPYCKTADEGRALFSRKNGDLLTVLPSVERLIIPFPARGENGALEGAFENLTELELPHTWRGTPHSNLYAPNLQSMTMRMPADIIAQMAPPLGVIDGCHFYVFDYAMNALFVNNPNSSQWQELVGAQLDPETREEYYTNLHAIDRPTEQLYRAEVRPMYSNLPFADEAQGIIWAADWNKALEETYPQYFPSFDVQDSRNDYKALFRNYLASHYLTPNHYRAFAGPDSRHVKCLDGDLILADGFDVNNFTNWFLHKNFIPAKDYVDVTEPLSPNYGRSATTFFQPYSADPAPQSGVSDYGIFYNTTDGLLPDPSVYSGGSPTAYFALHMVPGVSYDIYAVVPPSYPFSTDEMSYKNMITAALSCASVNEETGVARITKLANVNMEYFFENAKADTLLLYEDVQVVSDIYNLLEVRSATITAARRKEGYTPIFALTGILCQPRTQLETYPDVVEGTKAADAAVVVERLDLQGRHLAAPRRGVNILRMSDGTTRKVLVR